MADGDLFLEKNANCSEGFVEQGGTKHRSVLTAIVPGSLELSKNPSIDTGFVKDTNGFKHKVHLVAVLNHLRLSQNPSVSIGYAKDQNGFEHKVHLVAELSGGGGGSLPVSFREFDTDATGLLIPSVSTTRKINLNGAKDISDYALYRAYYQNDQISGTLDFSSLEQLTHLNSLYYAFFKTTGLNEVNMFNVTLISGNNVCNAMFRNSGIDTIHMQRLVKISGNGSCSFMFAGTGNLQGASLPSLESVVGTNACDSMFAGSALKSFSASNWKNIQADKACLNEFSKCINLIVVQVPMLETISGTQACKGWFQDCTLLQEIEFPKLSKIAASAVFDSAFRNSGIQEIKFPELNSTSFGTYTDQFHDMLSGTNNCVVHFPSNLQSLLSTWTDVQNKFGSTTATVLFNLPATF
ncbi:MAG: hypothetical protein IKA10_04460 [Oscillospiraceae bacterium]|nr:hypothetical protein [Oscillospiraceae bacterium]